MSFTEDTAHDEPCNDPECDGIAEMERDGEHIYFECQECGNTFGYKRVAEQTDTTCAIGIPENLRRAFSEPGQEQRIEPIAVPVSIGRRS